MKQGLGMCVLGGGGGGGLRRRGMGGCNSHLTNTTTKTRVPYGNSHVTRGGRGVL